MRVNRRTFIQLVIFAVIALVAGTVMAVGYIRVPTMLGIGRYTVTVELATSGGLYPSAIVTYRGTKVGKVGSVDLNENGGVAAVLSLQSGIDIPSNLTAQVHSQSALGEQYVALLPRDGSAAPLKDGDVIGMEDTSVPPAIDSLLDEGNRGLQAIPHDDLKTVVDESFVAVGGLGPELSRIVKGASQIAIDAHANLDSLTTLIDQSAPVLDSQTETADSIQAWAAHLATITTTATRQRCRVGGSDRKRRLGRRRGPQTRRPITTNVTDNLGKPRDRRQDRARLPTSHRAAVGANSTGSGQHSSRRRPRSQHQARLCRRLPQLQSQLQLAPTMHHRILAGPAAPDSRRNRRTGPSSRQMSIAGHRRIHPSTSVAQKICRV